MQKAVFGIASKVVSIAEGRFVNLAGVTPGPAALGLSARAPANRPRSWN
ncbi:hypothetical protein ACWFRJ_40030 [Streptomyces sp. NPDC055239]